MHLRCTLRISRKSPCAVDFSAVTHYYSHDARVLCPQQDDDVPLQHIQSANVKVPQVQFSHFDKIFVPLMHCLKHTHTPKNYSQKIY